MNSDTQLQIVVRAIDDASATLAKVKGELGELGASTAAAMESTSLSTAKATASLDGLASKLTPIAIGAAAGLALSAKSAMAFDQSMELIATQAGATQQEVDSLTHSVLALAPAVGQTPEKLAQGLFFIESAGFRGSKAMDLLKLSAQGAAVGQADLAETANALTSAMNTNINGAQTATQAMGNLNAIVGAGKMHFADLNEAISSGFLNTAALFGVSLDSVGAALATLTRNGEPAAQAATRLRMAITLMGAPSNVASKALAGIGIDAVTVKASTEAMTKALADAHVTTNQLAADMRQPDGINVAMLDLKSHLESAGLSSEQAAAVIARAFGGGRTSGPIMALLQDTKGLGDTFTSIQKNANDFGNDWVLQQQQAKQKMDDFKASVDVMAINLGNVFLPVLISVVKVIGDFAGWLGRLNPAQLQIVVGTLVTAVGLVVGLRAVVFAIELVEAATKAWAAVQWLMNAALDANPIGLFIVAVGALIAITYEIVKHWTAVKNFFTGLWNDLDKVFGGHLSTILAIVSPLLLLPNALIASWQPVSSFFKTLWSDVSNAAKAISNVTGTIGGTASGVLHNLHIPGFASGVQNFEGGLAYVHQGEALVNLPKGTDVIPANKVDSMGGGVTINQTNYNYSQFDLQKAAAELGFAVRHA